MPYVKTKDGVDIYYEVSGEGTPFLFLSEPPVTVPFGRSSDPRVRP